MIKEVFIVKNKLFFKLLSCVLVVTLCFPLLSVVSVSADTEGDFTYYFSLDKAIITGYEGKETNLMIPSEIKGSPVVGIYESAFEDNTTLESIVIPDSVSEIGDYAFSGCRNLSQVALPDTMSSIGYSAFKGCEKLKSIVIPKGVLYIEDLTFSGCSSLSDVTIPCGVTDIGSSAFSCCYKLSSVDIPDSVESIGFGAFGSSGLESIVIPSGVKRLGFYAFSYCEKLSEISILSSNIDIESNVFDSTAYYENSDNWENGMLYIDKALIRADHTYSGKYSIKEGTLTIAEGTFCWCNNLTEIYIPSSLVYISQSAFPMCDSLKAIVVDKNNKVYDSRDNCNGIIETTTNTLIAGCPGTVIPTSVTSIGAYAFANNETLYSVEITEGVVSIGYKAFDSCDYLKTITIPSTVKVIEQGAFSTTYDLSEVYYNGTQNQWEEIDIHNDNYRLLRMKIKFLKGEESSGSAVDGILGDVDSDGDVTIKDATRIQKTLAGLVVLSDLQKAFADVDGVGDINIKDATVIQKYVAGIDTGFFS